MSFKFPLYVALCVSLIYYSFATTANPRLEVLGEGEYAIYSREDVKSSLVDRRVSSGIGFIYYVDSKDVAELRGKFAKIDGESIVISGKSAREIFKKLGYTLVDGRDSSTSLGMTSYYGYSPRGLLCIKSGQQKINLQVVERGATTVVGWPVVLGSY